MARAPAQSEKMVAVMSAITTELLLAAEISCSATLAAFRMSISSGSPTTVSGRATAGPTVTTSFVGSGRSRAFVWTRRQRDTPAH
jgi:hypothetical protein